MLQQSMNFGAIFENNSMSSFLPSRDICLFTDFGVFILSSHNTIIVFGDIIKSSLARTFSLNQSVSKIFDSVFQPLYQLTDRSYRSSPSTGTFDLSGDPIGPDYDISQFAEYIFLTSTGKLFQLTEDGFLQLEFPGLENVKFLTHNNVSATMAFINSPDQFYIWYINHSAIPTHVPLLKDVKDVSLGAYHGVVLHYDGSVTVFGSNKHLQLGIPEVQTVDVASAIQIPHLPPMKMVSAGKFHTIALSVDGIPWIWGSDEEQQGFLGLGEVYATGPRQLPFTDVTFVAATAKNSFFSKGIGCFLLVRLYFLVMVKKIEMFFKNL
ncbi:hypothetical protein GEMRC1_011908 [Eukaryota sp. GEM-RC1]